MCVYSNMFWTVASFGLQSRLAKDKGGNYWWVRYKSGWRSGPTSNCHEKGIGERDKPRVGNPTSRYEGLQGMGNCTVQLCATWWLVTELSPIPRADTYRGTDSRTQAKPESHQNLSPIKSISLIILVRYSVLTQ
jgi:hypothetical protein